MILKNKQIRLRRELPHPDKGLLLKTTANIILNGEIILPPKIGNNARSHCSYYTSY